ncbi:hypothetical protein [Bacteroides heparinolyticus]
MKVILMTEIGILRTGNYYEENGEYDWEHSQDEGNCFEALGIV